MAGAEFKKFADIRKERGWIHNRDRPAGQQWYHDDGFCTNGCGEGFMIPRNSNKLEIDKIIDALNERDYTICELEIQLKRVERQDDEED